MPTGWNIAMPTTKPEVVKFLEDIRGTLSPLYPKEVIKMSGKRKVEIFIAGCPLCDETVKLVKSLSCPSCDVVVYNLKEKGMDKARKYEVYSVPTIVVDGKILDCCVRRKPTEADLKAAGIGTSL